MKLRLFFPIAFSVAVGFAVAQSAPPAQRGGPGGGGFGGAMGMGMMPGGGIIGTVTEVAADHYKVKSESGGVYTVYFSVNTRIFKQPAGMRGGGPRRNGGEATGPGPAMGRGGATPEQIKPTDIKVGDAIGAMGEVNSSAKSVGAIAIAQLDPERARQMEQMQASYGKTWIAGKVTAIDGVKVTVGGTMDNRPLSFVADENTTFRKRRDPVTLADIQIGDTVRAEGVLKNGVFTATTVNVMGGPPAGSPPQ
jgi:hypothetical protein